MKNIFIAFFVCCVALVGYGQNWVPATSLGDPYGKVNALEVYDSALYIGGEFEIIGGLVMPYLVKWDGVSFSTIGTFPTIITDLIEYNGALFIAGTENVWKYDGNTLIDVGINPYIGMGGGSELCQILWVHNNILFIKAFANSIGLNQNGSGIFSYNGVSFSIDVMFDLSSGTYPCACHYKTYNGELYSSGDYWWYSGGVLINGCINKWDGQSWVDVAGNVTTQPVIKFMEVYNGKLIVLGSFNNIGGQQINNMAEFDSPSFLDLSHH